MQPDALTLARSIQETALIELRDGEFAEIADIMQREARIFLPETKHTLVHSRLTKRLRHLGLRTFDSYVQRVRSDAAERAFMVEALTTNHTHFFREAHHFSHLKTALLPRLKANALAGKPVRIWSAGCSSGEEVYTIAMCLLGADRAESLWARQGQVKLLATDIAPAVVEAVRRAEYPAAAADAVPPAYRAVWMEQRGDNFTMAPEVRGLVQANVLNLFDPCPMRHKYDAIFCRNVMIYFDSSTQQELVEKMSAKLSPGGYLIVGHSESLLGISHDLRHVLPSVYVRDPR